MKKLLFAFISLFLVSPLVNADTLLIPSYLSSSQYHINTSDYNSLLDYYNQNLSSSNSYYLFFYDTQYDNIELWYFDSLSDIEQMGYSYTWSYVIHSSGYLTISNNVVTNNSSIAVQFTTLDYDNNGTTSEYFDYTYLDSNFDLPSIDFGEFPFNEVEISGFYSDNIILQNGASFPKLKDLLSSSSWSDYVSSQEYTTINLDDYEYVILSLKNYNQSDAFQTDFQLKGQVGITPVYNYGQSTKDSITGSQVQDRCNVSYSDYTYYPFYILQTDLQNNVVYYVKSCSEGSSFKFNNSVFNVSYVTQSNIDNPSVTINGTTYNTIPYDDLPSSATQNEIDNYIPGESIDNSVATSDALSVALKNAQNWLSSIWDMITYFTSFVALIFTSLPTELHAILLSAFTLTLIIGLIKHFTG